MQKFSQKSSRQLANDKLTNHARGAFFEAEKIAKKMHHLEITSLHLLYAIFLQKGSLGSNIMKDLGIKEVDLQKIFLDVPSNQKLSTQKDIPISNELTVVFTKSYSIAKEFSYAFVGTEHLTYAIIASANKNLLSFISSAKLKNISESIKLFFNPNQLPEIPKIFDIPEFMSNKFSSKKTSPTPFIDKFCVNVNVEAREKSENIIGRDQEIQRMIDILGRKNKNNPVLIGEAGVGKTALVSGLAIRMNAGDIPHSLYRKKIMNLDIAQLIAGTSFRGEFESRLKEIIKEMQHNKNIILFIDELHTIVGTGNIAGGLDLANIIKPALARGDIQIIGATTFSEYKKHIEKDSALERRFQPVQVAEPSRKQAKEMLFGIRKNYEMFHNVILPDESIKLAVDLSIRYIQNRFLPDKAIDVIDETASTIRSRHKISDFLHQIKKLEDEKLNLIEKKEKLVGQEDFATAASLRDKEREITKQIKILQDKQSASEKTLCINITNDDIIRTISKISKISIEKLSADTSHRIQNIQKNLNTQIIGQKESIEKIAKTLFRSQSGIGNPARPLGSFLFLGPTGVGKTLTAKVLAQEFFADEKSFIRVDMSELMERHSVSSLIGSPAGYIGYGEGGKLTEKVRRNPYSIVLFDEIEKAHPDVFNILLQILEDGILTDAEGLQVDFKNTFIILTSNIGTSEFTNASKVGFETTNSSSESLSAKFNTIKNKVIKDLEKIMKPEILNRLDHVLVFNSLDKKEIKKITSRELKKIVLRLRKQKIELSLDKAIPVFIAEKSLAKNQGARLVRKNIQDMLEDRIAEMIIYDKVRNGKIKASIRKEEIRLV